LRTTDTTAACWSKPGRRRQYPWLDHLCELVEESCDWDEIAGDEILTLEAVVNGIEWRLAREYCTQE